MRPVARPAAFLPLLSFQQQHGGWGVEVSEAAAFLIGLGQQVWQQELPRDQGGTACLVSVMPFLLAAGILGVRACTRLLRARRLPSGQQP